MIFLFLGCDRDFSFLELPKECQKCLNVNHQKITMARKSKEFRKLFYPDSVQQRKSSVSLSQRQRELAALQSFKQQIANDPDYEGTMLVENPKDFRKMSEVLLEYVEPFLDETETYEDRSNLIDFAMMAWNLALIPEESRKELLTEFVTEICSEIEEVEEQKTLKQLMNQLIKRKLKFFAEEERFVKEYKLTENGGRIHLAVASSVIP